MGYVITILITASLSYPLGYFARKWTEEERVRAYRKQMGLQDIPEECQGCKNLGLPCDPSCRYYVAGKERD